MVAMQALGTAQTRICPDDVVALVRLLCGAQTNDELTNGLMAFIRPRGFAGFTFAIIRRVKSLSVHVRVLSSWSDAVQLSFEQQSMMQHDPVIIQSRSATGPFIWDLSLYDDSNTHHVRLKALRQASGIEGGVCLPVFEAMQGRAVLYLTGTDFDTSPDSIVWLQLVAEHLSNTVNAILARRGEGAQAGNLVLSHVELSPRERQVFGWIAFGKSSKDIAAIMTISEHTVNDHIASAVAKLGASNRTEALLRAVLTNQIDLT